MSTMSSQSLLRFFSFILAQKGRLGGEVNKHTPFRTIVDLKYINRPSYFSPKGVVQLTEKTRVTEGGGEAEEMDKA